MFSKVSTIEVMFEALDLIGIVRGFISLIEAAKVYLPLFVRLFNVVNVNHQVVIEANFGVSALRRIAIMSLPGMVDKSDVVLLARRQFIVVITFIWEECIIVFNRNTCLAGWPLARSSHNKCPSKGLYQQVQVLYVPPEAGRFRVIAASLLATLEITTTIESSD
jgi:hypothetical protein